MKLKQFKTVFITREGRLKNYAQSLGMISKTGSSKLKKMQAALDQTFKMCADYEATAENAELLWDSLFSIGKKAEQSLSEQEKKYEAFIEMEEWLVGVGYELAWGERRKGITVSMQSRYVSRFIAMNPMDPEFINAYLKVLVCVATLQLSATNANKLFKRIDDMSNEELMLEAIKDQERLKNEKERDRIAHTPVYNFETPENPF